jgi:superfamily II DNA or RNA helicase
MSVAINLISLSLDDKKKIADDITINVKPPKFNKFAKIKYIYPFEIDDDKNILYCPFAYSRENKFGKKPSFEKFQIDFNGKLRKNQEKIKEEAFEHIRKKGSTIISAYPGCGKTCMSIYIATCLKVKTLIVTHRIVLIKQWKDSIFKFCGNKNKNIVQVVTAKTKQLDPKAFFYIMNATNISKKNVLFFEQIGLVCVDECHLIMAECLSKCMQCLTPRYLIGLSATPYREDGLNKLLDLYFGKEKIHRKLFRKHTVYKVSTKFTPEQKRNPMTGRIDWSNILDQQSDNIDRNNLIIKIVKQHQNRNFLILCKRIKQGEYLIEKLKKEGEDVTSLLGKQQTYNQDSRILIGTSSKAGVGFDHPKLDALLLASDIQSYFIQYLGRVLRRPDVEPIIFDIVDNNSVLKSHYYNRRKIYIKHGGTIHNYEF